MSPFTNLLNMPQAERLALVARCWPILDRLYSGRSFVTQISKEIGKQAPQVSRELKDLMSADLVKSDREGRRMFYALTASGRRAVEAGRHIMVDNSPSQRPEADPKELDFLLSKIRPTSSEQATEEASAFLLKIVSTHQIAKADMARIVSSANRFLSDEKEHWSRWLWILNMLSRTSDDSETTRLMGDKALPRVLALIKKPELQ